MPDEEMVSSVAASDPLLLSSDHWPSIDHSNGSVSMSKSVLIYYFNSQVIVNFLLATDQEHDEEETEVVRTKDGYT